MTNTTTKTRSGKVTLNTVRDIPFNKLSLSQANVRTVKDAHSIEDLAQDIARRGLLQSLSVRPVLDEDGNETGRYEVPAGGRRFRALELLIRQKRLPKTAPIPCIVRTAGTAAEDSLAENVQREALHPLDQFRAFQRLRDQGMSEEDIAARFFVTPHVVRQRLKLAAVSPKLLKLYAEGEMDLEQLMGFTVTDEHGRQEQVWDIVSQSAWNRHRLTIRRMLTETAVRADDRRALFVGIEAYENAGGRVMRDLFTPDDGGWLEDATVLDRLVSEKLDHIAAGVKAEGWAWVDAALDFPYGHTHAMGRIQGEPRPLSEDQIKEYEALKAEMNRLNAEYEQADELPDEVDERLGEIETRLEELDALHLAPAIFEPEDMARAGAVITIGRNGSALVECGFVRPEDEPGAEPPDGEDAPAADSEANGDGDAPANDPGSPAHETDEADEPGDAALKPLSDRLVSELTAHRTLALREALARSPDTAFVAVLHALCLSAFYPGGVGSCLEITGRSASFTAQEPGLKDSLAAKAIEARHAMLAQKLPDSPADLWGALVAMEDGERRALLAHCAARTVNAVNEPWTRVPARIGHADTLATTIGLDMRASGWRPTVDNYLGRVPKARILAAVRESCGDRPAARIEHMKKPAMAEAAERLLAGTDWLPEPLRTPEPVPEQEPAPELNSEQEPEAPESSEADTQEDTDEAAAQPEDAEGPHEESPAEAAA